MLVSGVGLLIATVNHRYFNKSVVRITWCCYVDPLIQTYRPTGPTQQVTVSPLFAYFTLQRNMCSDL